MTPRRVSYIVTGSRPWRMVRRTLAAGLLALVLAGCATPAQRVNDAFGQPTARPVGVQPTARPAGVRAVVTRSGDNTEKTDRFMLVGSYEVFWFAANTGSVDFPCVAGGFLQPVGQMLFNVNVDKGQRATDTTHAYDLASGGYYLDMYSNCEWRVTLTPE